MSLFMLAIKQAVARIGSQHRPHWLPWQGVAAAHGCADRASWRPLASLVSASASVCGGCAARRVAAVRGVISCRDGQARTISLARRIFACILVSWCQYRL